MIVHYVSHHQYSPPAEFIEAVMRSPLPDSEDYSLIVEKFRLSHEHFWDQLRCRHE
jgi:hypothetical protein